MFIVGRWIMTGRKMSKLRKTKKENRRKGMKKNRKKKQTKKCWKNVFKI